MSDYDDLRAKAQAAADRLERRGQQWHQLRPGDDEIGRLIAAADPAVLLDLIERLEKAEAERAAALRVMDAHKCDDQAERAYSRAVRAEAERDEARTRLGKCLCVLGPDTDGPDEACPQHGLSYADWVERSDGALAAVARAEAIIAGHIEQSGALHGSPWSVQVVCRAIRKALRGED